MTLLILVVVIMFATSAICYCLENIKKELVKLNSKPIDWDMLPEVLAAHRPKIKESFKKPTKGWNCPKCDTFNHDMRVECHHCGLGKGRLWSCLKCDTFNHDMRVECHHCGLGKGRLWPFNASR